MAWVPVDSQMDDWTLIVGLGNPGERYVNTRHNAGFMVVDQLAKAAGAGWSRERKFTAMIAKADRQRLVLCKPLTYMNLSGQAVKPIMSFYRIPISRLLIVVDDADLAVGGLRMRPRGSSGGHHGLDSVNQHLGSTEYARQKIGIGRDEPGRREIVDHVLGEFSTGESAVMQKVFERACSQINCWLEHGIEKAMNQYNGTVVVSE
jgi:PTH1 family peptidyl-tRNA hydrolase